MPLLIGPEMARHLPENSTEPLGEFLLEGLLSPYTLYGAADSAELVPPAELWASLPQADDASPGGPAWPDGSVVDRLGRVQSS